ncbi:hypothetical protein [Pseudonocardia alni]|uniref:hypothetical protein n=1 Tax=Pseudonocardia alni TaxID=33907 RepID=UPI00279EF9ED|nr:hypothetical protein PaSha_01440 [Pseudonocardia alni]
MPILTGGPHTHAEQDESTAADPEDLVPIECRASCGSVRQGFRRRSDAWPRTLPPGRPVLCAYWIPELLARLDNLRVVVLLGVVAEIAWEDAELGWSALTVIAGPSPGSLGMSDPGAPERLKVAFDQVVAALA